MDDGFDWVFFDCFNTLIDDFDDDGDESGLGSLPQIATSRGLFSKADDFVSAYREARKNSALNGRECHFSERLRRTLELSPAVLGNESLRFVVAEMLEHWEKEYRNHIRLTPGIENALLYWANRRPLGVISNFFLPGYPSRYLREFGIEHHFQFVLDSATFGYKKPHQSIFMHALKLAGLTPQDSHRVLMVGDRLDLDILPARELGFQSLHFNRRSTRPAIAETPAGIPRVYDLADFR